MRFCIKSALTKSMLSILVLVSGCGELTETASDTVSTSPGSIVSVTTDFFPKTFIQGIVDASSTLQTAGFNPKYTVNQYNITYATVDSKGNSTIASAKLLVPSYNANLDTVVYLHGTTTLDSDAPTNTYIDLSNFDGSNPLTIDTNIVDLADSTNLKHFESLLCTILAAEGKAVLLPDYLGFGASDGIHPYMHGESLATAALNALRASKALADSATVQFTLSDNFILTGYSEGGYATMATHKELLDSSDDDDYTDLDQSTYLKGVIPGAPPCSLSIVMTDQMINNGSYPVPAFAPYVLLGYNQVYSVFEDVSDAFDSAYSSIESSFDGSMSLDVINSSIDVSAPIEVFSSSIQNEIAVGLADYSADYVLNTATTSGLYEKLILNDVWNYDPGATVPYYFLHLNADTTVPITNTLAAVSYMTTQGEASLMTSGGNMAVVDPTVPTALYSTGTVSDHSTGFAYYFFVMRSLLDSLL